MSITRFMSWIGGVDLTAMAPGASQPNLIVHVARAVTTPLGTAPAGLVFFQPNPDEAPLFFGFVCPDPVLGAYFGPNIFAGTPFENAPVLVAEISIHETESQVSARIEIVGFVIETRLGDLGSLETIDRACGAPMPFRQQGLESPVGSVSVTINGEKIAVVLPPYTTELGGSVWAPAGVYAR